MWKTVLLLIVTLLVVPFCAFYFDEPLSDKQWSVLKVLIAMYVIASSLCFIVSTIAKNYSQVDKLWSVIPIAYAWVACWLFEFEPRLILMAILVSIWGLRLTLNFARRGGYSWKFWEGDEDYRWAVLQAKPEFQGRWKWIAFNLFFISFYQMGLILLFTLPIVKSSGESVPIGVWDILLSVLYCGFVVTELIADNQQWKFQQEKYRYINKGEQVPTTHAHGFIRSGLWGVVRHPNYASEQAIWIVFYFFSVIVTGNWLNWSVVGCTLLILLFKGSSDFSEEISSGKYPEYRDYQKNVPRFIPFTKW